MTTMTMPMLATYPKPIALDRQQLATTIDAAIACAEACTACADACLSEDMVAELTKCIRTCTDCSDVCDTTFRVLSRHTGYDANITRALLDACRVACASCAWITPTSGVRRPCLRSASCACAAFNCSSAWRTAAASCSDSSSKSGALASMTWPRCTRSRSSRPATGARLARVHERSLVP